MMRTRVLGIDRIVEPMWVVAELEIKGARLWARVDCDFDEDDMPRLAEGDELDVDLNWDGHADSLTPAQIDVIGVYGEDEHTVLVGRVTEFVGEKKFIMDCGVFQLPVDVRGGNLPEWLLVGALVQIHVGTTVWADLQTGSEGSHKDEGGSPAV